MRLRSSWGWSRGRNRGRSEAGMRGGWPMLSVEHAAVAHHSRDSVLEDELLLAVVFEEHGIFIEGADFTRQFDAADQINGDRGLVFANRIQEGVLNVLCRLVLHVPISCFLKFFRRYVRCYPAPSELQVRG